MNTLASFLLVNYNSYEDLFNAIQEIHLKAKSISYEILVFDNASSEEERTRLKNLTDPKVHVLFSGVNLGYGAGNNRLAKMAVGELLVLVNPDIGQISGNLKLFLEKYKNTKTGAWAPAILYPNGTVQPNGGGKSTPWTFIFQSLRLGAMVRKFHLIWFFQVILTILPFLRKTVVGTYIHNFNVNQDCDMIKDWNWLSGAFLVIPKEIYKLFDGFDESFFLYHEDEDLGHRIHAQGYKIIQDRSLTVVHSVGGSQKKLVSKRLSRAYIERMKSRVYYAQKHFSKGAYYCIRFYFFVYCTFLFLGHAFCFQFGKAWDFIRLSFALLIFDRSLNKKETDL